MKFGEGFVAFYTMLLDASVFVSIFFVSFGIGLYALKKNPKKKDYIKSVIIGLCCYATFMIVPAIAFGLTYHMNGDNPFKTLIYSFSIPLVVLIFCLVVRKDYRLHRYIKTMILVSVIIICDVVSKNLGFYVGGAPGEISFLFILARSGPFLVFPGFCFLIHKIDIARYRHLSIEMIFILTVISFLLIVIGVQEHFDNSDAKEINVLLAVLDTTLLFLLGYSYFATYKNVENRHLITNLEVQKTLEEAEKMTIAVDKVNREELQKIRHDIKNQLSYVNVLVQQGKNDEAIKYINDFLNSENEVLNFFSCSNDVINSIINMELTKAKIEKIKIDVKVVVPPALPFSDVDLVSLLTNMIDNAIENYYSETPNFIIVRIFKQNDFIRFIVSNPLNVANVNPRGITITRKLGRGHGYGTKIIRNVVKKYEGGVDFKIEGDRFVCDAILNLDAKE